MNWSGAALAPDRATGGWLVVSYGPVKPPE